MTNKLSILNDDQEIFVLINDIVNKAVVSGDPLIALEFGSSIKREATIKGLALAKLLYKLQENWHLFQAAGIEGELEDLVDAHMDIRPATTKKYVAMWKNIFDNAAVPMEVKDILTERPVGDLLLLTAAVGEGSLVGEDLKSAALSPDQQSIREYVKKARGEHTSSGTAITIILNRVDRPNMKAGTLYAKQGNKRVVLGIIFEPENELAEKAIMALVNGRPIVEAYQ